jgi:hypothetical protein
VTRGSFLWVLLAACGQAPPTTEPPAAPEPTAVPEAPVAAPPAETVPTPDEAALAVASAAADELGRTLRARLMAAMAEGGPARAAEVCSTEAATLSAEIAARSGASVGRGSLRMRGRTPPPAWVQAWLEAQGERPAAGVSGFARIEFGHARVLRPIAVEGPCLVCHGASPAPELAALLAARYPTDRATGYAEGDLRGALYAEAPVR